MTNHFTRLKRLMLAFVLIGAFVQEPIYADEHGIIIQRTDGTRNFVSFKDKPKVSFNDYDEIVFTTATSGFAIPLNSVESYSFGEKTPDISSVDKIVINKTIDFSISDNEIVIRNITPKSPIRLFNLSGILMTARVSSATENDARIDISGIQKGTYILSIGTESFKFIKR